MKTVFYVLNVVAAQLLTFLIVGIRSLLGPVGCRYEITCTRFAVEQLKNQPFIPACKTITQRIIACRPLNRSTLFE